MSRGRVLGTVVRSASVLVCLVVSACGGGKSEEPDPANPGDHGGYGQPATYGQPLGQTATFPSTAASANPVAPPPATPTPAPLAPVTTTDPGALAALVAQAETAPAADLVDASSDDAIGAGLKRAAAKSAPGMKPEGQMARGKLAAGGHLSFMVPMVPGKCYTVVGFAPPGTVKNLDLNLLAPPLYNLLAGQDATDDNAPVLGGSPSAMCPTVTFQLPYKVDVAARAGAGSVGVQVYSKAK